MDDQFDFYITTIDEYPASIFVNMSVGDSAPLKGYVYLTSVYVPMLRPYENGLSSQDEFDVLTKLENAIVDTVVKAPAIFAGRITGNSERAFFFYSAHAFDLEPQLRAVFSDFPEYSYRWSRQDDPEWKCYRERLFPPPEQLQKMGNRVVVENLKKHGDGLETPREVEHWIYFRDPQHRADFTVHVSALGYSAEATEVDQEESDEPFCLRLKRIDRVDQDSIDAVTLELCDLAKRFQGNYDGWETAVIAPKSRNKSPFVDRLVRFFRA
jgi:uncharacterized protein (TIGR01619 family)